MRVITPPEYIAFFQFPGNIRTKLEVGKYFPNIRTVFYDYEHYGVIFRWCGMIHTLLVDDEPMLLDIAKLFIERTGEVTVETAGSAEEGYGKIKTGDYDIVVSDYEMPGMNGIEFLRTLREEANSIPFIIFTGRGREDVVIEALNYGVDYYIQKGGDPGSQFTELIHMIIRAVEEQRVRINLEKSEKRFFGIFNHLPDPTMVINHVGVVIAWNKGMKEITGVDAVDIVGCGDYAYTQAIYGIREPTLIDLILDPHADIAGVHTITHKEHDCIIAETDVWVRDAEFCTYWIKATPIYGKNKSVNGAICSIRDITEKKRAEEALRTANEYSRSLIEAHIDPLVTIDAGGLISDVNSAMEELTGFSRDLLVGTAFSGYFTEPKEAQRGYMQVMEGDILQELPLTVVTSKRETMPVWFFASPYRDPDGDVKGAFAEVHRQFPSMCREESLLYEANRTEPSPAEEKTASQ